MNKHYLTQFTEYFGEDEVKRNYAHTVDDKFLKCKTDRKEFNSWLKNCPVDYDVIEQTSDVNIVTINFHDKNIYNKVVEE